MSRGRQYDLQNMSADSLHALIRHCESRVRALRAPHAKARREWADLRRRAQAELAGRSGWEAPQRRRCECGAADCDAVVYMTWDEQDRTDHTPRDTPRRWAIAPGYSPRDGVRWQVIEHTDRFVIVEIDEEDGSA
jgi:hypothetical protein